MIKLLDSKNRELKMGERVRIEKNIPSPNGMLYENTLVKLQEFDSVNNKVKVTDSMGKVWWIEPLNISASFL